MIVDASDFGDGCGEWYSVLPEDVERVSQVKTKDILSFVCEHWNMDGGEEEIELENWLESNAQVVLSWINKNALTVEPTYVKTI